MDIPLHGASAAVVGATGTIGQVCADMLADDVDRLYLIGRSQEKLDELRERLKVHARAELIVSTKMNVLSDAQLILTVTGAVHDVIRPQFLQPGSVVCDVARPRDVSAMVAAVRDDILVIDGGMVDVPGAVDFHFNFGFPAGKVFACMAETIALTLEGRFEDYTLGKRITRERVEEIGSMARKHGFRLSGFRSFEREVTPRQIETVRRNAKKAKLASVMHT
jgi:predicted amino acid dehydrogenase